MSLYERLCGGQEKLAVVGLGYIGLPLALAFSRKTEVIAFDVDERKTAQYRAGVDPTGEADAEALRSTAAEFTSDEARLREARFHIVAVPTPVCPDNTPDLSFVEQSSRTVGRNLRPGSIVVYESTVYPGATEEVCVPILERESGLRCGRDFSVGYSPERINPGDRVHRLETVVKVVSAMNTETLDTVAAVYGMVAEAGLYRAPSIRVAEAAKVVENTQRDVNIAFMNELSVLFHQMGLDTQEVLAAAATKWNFLNFQPGLVGGHCVGVDPYYLTSWGESGGFHSRLIPAARKINDDMGRYVAEQTVKRMLEADLAVKRARVAVLGVTFKENCADIRSSGAVRVIRELADYGVEPVVVDPKADREQVLREYGIALAEEKDLHDLDAVVVAVAHDAFRSLTPEGLARNYKSISARKKVLIDVRAVLDRQRFEDAGYLYWRL